MCVNNLVTFIHCVGNPQMKSIKMLGNLHGQTGASLRSINLTPVYPSVGSNTQLTQDVDETLFSPILAIM